MPHCAQCREFPAQADGLCRRCRLLALGLSVPKYHFTDALRAQLRAAYALPKLDRFRAVAHLAAQTGWPRGAFKREANRMGLKTWRRRAWCTGEDDYLRAHAGLEDVVLISKKYLRTHSSIERRMSVLGLSRLPREGYNLRDLAAVFGARYHRVKCWMDRGLLGKPQWVCREWRIDERALIRFLRHHPHEYDLRRVDQIWFKAMLFGALASMGGRV